MTKRRELSVIVDEIHIELKRDTAGIIKIGALLAEAKGQVKHGEWLPWLEENFSMSKATAQRYLQVHKFLKNRTVRDLEAAANLSASALYDLAGDAAMARAAIHYYTPEAVEAVLDEAAAGKRVGRDRAWSITSKIRDAEEEKAAAEAEALKRAEAETKPQQEAATENIVNFADAAEARANEWIETTAEQEAAAAELEAADQPKQPEADASAETRNAFYADDAAEPQPQPEPQQPERRVVTKAELMIIVGHVASLGDGSDLTIPDADLELWDALHGAMETLRTLTSSMVWDGTALSKQIWARHNAREAEDKAKQQAERKAERKARHAEQKATEQAEAAA
jgi:hypothetical protein